MAAHEVDKGSLVYDPEDYELIKQEQLAEDQGSDQLRVNGVF